MRTVTTRFLAIAVLSIPVMAFSAPNPHANPTAIYVAPVCPGPQKAGAARCNAWLVTDANGVPKASGIASPNAKGGGGKGGPGGGGGGGTTTPPPAPPAGAYGPIQFQTAYGLTGLTSNGATVAIVDAYDDPNIEQDLASYSQAYNLPSCTSSNKCFKKVNQRGGKRLPAANQGWALEISLDVQAVHAACPDCKILLVEANSSSLSDLLTAEAYAGKQAGVVVVSNSWGASEFSSESSYDSYFNFGVPVTFSSGDNGYGVQWPAAAPNVTAVGGTTLTLNSNNTRYSETAWSYAGSGCSAYEAQPAWQYGLGSGVCPNNRMVADVAADADPATGAAVYDTYGYNGASGWFIVGGTSLASPLVAATYALDGDKPSLSTLYARSGQLYDVTSGSNGSCGTLLCNAQPGYDGPTGLGTPGASAF